MSASFRLAKAWSMQHRRRALLVITAIAIAISLIVFTTSSYAALLQRSSGFAQDLMGRWDVVVTPQIALQPQISAAFEQALRDDERVKYIIRTQVLYCDIEDAANTTYYDSWRAACIATFDGRAPMELASGDWPTVDQQQILGVLSGGFALRWRVSLGDVMPIHGPAGVFELRIVGITNEQVSNSQASGVFVHPESLKRLCGERMSRDQLYIDLRDGVSAADVIKQWKPLIAAEKPGVVLHDINAFAQELALDKSIKNLNLMNAAASVIILLAALFIVYSAMSAGTDERRRQLALLRCVGAQRGQVFKAVCMEALFLALCGTLLGVPLGVVFLELISFIQSGLFGGAVWPDVISVILAVGVAWFGVLVAALLPARAASRTKPLQVMHAQARERSAWPVWHTVLAIFCLSLSVGVHLAQGAVPVGATTAMTVLGLLFLGFSGLFSMRPLTALLAATLARPMAYFCSVPANLLRMEHAAQLRRVAAMILTLSICLGFSIMMNVWGRSMVIPFLPSPQLPDQVISLLPAGVPLSEADVLREMPGIEPQRVLPMRVEQTMLGKDLLALTKGGVDEIYVQILGIDPLALQAHVDDALLPIKSDLNDGPVASAALRDPLTCIVPASFARRFNVKPGEEIPLKLCGRSDEIHLRIVDLASLPGWQWITKMGRMRSFNGKPVAPVLVSMQTAEALGVTAVRHWLADTTENMDLAELRAALQGLADKHAGAYTNAHFGAAAAQKPSVKIIATGEVAQRMRVRSAEVIWVLGAIPLTALLIAILGVVNAVAASIRERQWELAIMRSIGLEGRQAVVLIIAEVGIVSLLAVFLSVFYGIYAAWSAIDVSLQLFDTGTSAPPLVIPYLDIAISSVITVSSAILAAWIPARALKQRKTIELLRAGRADS